jgi:predicted ATPase
LFIEQISVSNFKSFKKIDVKLNDLNVLIGPNASGKSNFVNIFKFIRDIALHSLEDAISIQGGVDYFRNINIGRTENFSFKLVKPSESPRERALIRIRTNDFIKIINWKYNLDIQFHKRGSGYRVVKDKISLFINILKRIKNGEMEEVGNGTIEIENRRGRIKYQFVTESDLEIKITDIVPTFFYEDIRLNTKECLLGKADPFPYIPFKESLGSIAFFDFDPKLPKSAVPITGKIGLEEDGQNLAIVLKRVTSNSSSRRKFINLLSNVLPFIDRVAFQSISGRSLIFKLLEKYSKTDYLPSSLISDGTINIISLILALYFERKQFIVMEEPERNVHPYLIKEIVSMLKDASLNKQIIITTHNPEVVKYIDHNDVLLISRDKEGFSKINKPSDDKEIMIFLNNEIGLEELFVQNLLGSE